MINKNIVLSGTSFYELDNNWNVLWYLKDFNLNNPHERILWKIYSFFKILYETEENENEKLFMTLEAEKWAYKIWDTWNDWLNFSWWQDMWDFLIVTNFSESSNKSNEIRFWYSNYQDKYLNLPIPQAKKENPEKYSFYEEPDFYDDIREEFLSFQEFYLLMQIYFWLYQEEEYKKELEENEKNWKYDKISTTPYFNEEITRDLVEEYLKLQLMQKDTSWAFDWLKIEKIYDKDWSQEKQREHIDEINNEFWEEIIVED
jgi:hypothetical protein